MCPRSAFRARAQTTVVRCDGSSLIRATWTRSLNAGRRSTIPTPIELRSFARGLEERNAMGMTYQRGAVWWIKYYQNGRGMRESSHSTKESKAKRLLKLREGLDPHTTKNDEG